MTRISINFNQPVPLFCAEVLRKYCGLLALMRSMGVLNDMEYQRLLAEVEAKETIIQEEV